MVASHAAVARSNPAECTDLYYTRRSGGTAHEGGGCDQSLDLPSLTPLSVAVCG